MVLDTRISDQKIFVAKEKEQKSPKSCKFECGRLSNVGMFTKDSIEDQYPQHLGAIRNVLFRSLIQTYCPGNSGSGA